MGLLDGLLNAAKKGLKKSVSSNIENKVFNAVVSKTGGQQNQTNNYQTQNAQPSQNGQMSAEQAQFVSSVAAAQQASVDNAFSVMTKYKMCGKCKQPCDINATVCPVCGSTEFKSMAQMAEEKEVEEE